MSTAYRHFTSTGTIGLTSICNTFMHIRTPLYLGFARTGYAVVLGILVGAVLIALLELCCRLYRKAVKNYVEAEQK